MPAMYTRLIRIENKKSGRIKNKCCSPHIARGMYNNTAADAGQVREFVNLITVLWQKCPEYENFPVYVIELLLNLVYDVNRNG